MTTDPTALPKAETFAEIVAEMRKADREAHDYNLDPVNIGSESLFTLGDWPDRLEAAHALEMAWRDAMIRDKAERLAELHHDLAARDERIRELLKVHRCVYPMVGKPSEWRCKFCGGTVEPAEGE